MKRKAQIGAAWLDSHQWQLSSDNDGVTYGGFKWPRMGQWVKCKDWNDRPECGGGFHGLMPAAHAAGLRYARPVLREYRGDAVVIDGDKCKVREARIVAIGDDIPDEAWTRCGYRVLRGKIKSVVADERCVARGAVRVESVTGGYVRACDTSALTIESVTGGEVHVYGTSTVNIESVTGGYVRVYGTSTVNIESAAGGYVRAYDTSALTIESVTGGYVWGHDTSKITIKNDKRKPQTIHP